MNERLLRLKDAKKASMVDIRKPHTCSARVCNPQCERDFGISTDCTLFLCNYGSIHRCGPDVCTIYSVHTGTCPLSGMQVGPAITSAYAKDDPRTWYQKAPQTGPKITEGNVVNIYDDNQVKQQQELAATTPPIKRPRIRKEKSQEEVEEILSNLLELLLYSSKRTQINELEMQKYEMHAAQARNTYITACREQGRFPFSTDVARIVGYHTSKALPLNELEREPKRLRFYINQLFQIWQISKRFYTDADEPKSDVETVALGALYMMRVGHIVDGHILLPKDLFLFCNLPLVNKITGFGIKKKKITKGEKILDIVYKRAREQKAPLETYTLTATTIDQEEEEQLFKSTSRNNVRGQTRRNGPVV